MRKLLAISFVTKYANVLIQIGIMSVLSRLLSPAEFGVVSVVQVLVIFFNILGNTGISTAIVQNKTLDQNEISGIYKLSIGIAILISIFFGLCAPLIAYFYSDSVYLAITRGLAVALCLSIASMVPQAILQKNKKFKQIGIINIIATVVAGGVAIVAAVNKASSFSIVYQAIVFAFITLIFSHHFSQFRFHKGLTSSGLKKIKSYSFYQFLFNMVNYFSRNADNLLIGKFLGTSALGYYNRAYQLMLMPVQQLTFVINPVLHPVLSENQNDKQAIYRGYLPVIRGLAFIGMLVGPLCALNAREIIGIMFGDQWELAVIPFSYLSISIPFQIITSTTGSVFQAANDTRRLFWVGTVNSFLIISLFSSAIFIWKNIEAVAVCITIAYIVVSFLTFFILLGKTLQVSALPMLNTICPYAFAGVASTLAMYFLPIRIFDDTDILRLIIRSAFGFVVYLSVAFSFRSGRSVLQYFSFRRKNGNG